MIGQLSAAVAWRALAAVVAMAAGAALVSFAYWLPIVRDVERSRAVLQERAASMGENIKKLNGQIEAQNQSVEALRLEAERRERLAKAALHEAESKSRQSDSRAQQILSERPPAGLDECSAASALIRKELQR